MEMDQDGIEIHFDEKRGYLELACEPDAYAEYWYLAREHVAGIPHVAIEKVVEIHITDTATFVARRDAPKRYLGSVIFAIIVLVVLLLAAIGAWSVFSRIVS